MKRVLKETAKTHGVTREEVEREIHTALMIAMKNQNKSNIELWNAIAPQGKETPIFDMIAALAKLVVNSSDKK